jgi:hypothetical protein
MAEKASAGPLFPGADRIPGEDVVDWGIRTGRVSAALGKALRNDPPEDTERLLNHLPPRDTAGRSITAPPAAEPAPAQPRVTFAPPQGVTGDAATWWARNPALDSVPDVHLRAALAVDPNPPGLFSTGDLPPFTASGIDPSALASVPWTARHRIAAEKDRARALEMVVAWSDPDAVGECAEMRNDAVNRNYVASVQQWVMRNSAEFDRRRREASRGTPAVAGSSSAEPVFDPDYDAVFGEMERAAKARQERHEIDVLDGRVAGHGYGPGGIAALKEKHGRV